MKRTPFLFSAGTPMAARCREYPWATSALGQPQTWDSALKTLVPIILGSNQPMFVAWGASRTLIYNDAYAELLANKHPDALGRDFLEVWHEIREDLRPIVEGAYAGTPVQMDDIELWIERRGYREETHFSFFYSPVRNEHGEIGGFYCACNEITTQILTERRIVESEAHHRGVLENMDEGFTLFDRDFTILEVNPAALRILGLAREQMVGQNHWELFPGTWEGMVGALYRQVLAEQRPGSAEHLYRFPDGRDVWFEVRAFPVGDGLASLFRDVTESKRLQHEAEASVERVQLALEAGAILGTWMWDIQNGLIVGDEQFALSFGLDKAVLKAGAPLDYVFRNIHPDDQEVVHSAINEAIEQCGLYRCQYRVFRDGEYRWVEANGRVDCDHTGAPVRFPGVLLDIEDRRRIEAERDAATSLLTTFIEAVPGAVYAKDLEGRYLVANRGTAEVLGGAFGQVIGRTDLDLLTDPGEAATLMERDRQIMASGVTRQAEEAVRWADGTPAIWWTTKAPLRDAEGKVIGLVGTSVDITARKATEDALRLSEQRSALAIEVAQLGTWRWDVLSGSVTVDDRCRQMFGLAGRRSSFEFDDLQQRIHPDDWPVVEKALASALDPAGTGHYAEEFRWLHADGRVVWTSSRGIAIFEGGWGSRRAVAMIGSVIDITERKQFDERRGRLLARKAFQLDLSDRLRHVGDADSMIEGASELLGKHLGAIRVLYAEVNDPEGTVFLRRDWTSPGTLSVAGDTKTMDDFGPAIVAQLRAGLVVANHDVTRDPRTAESTAAYQAWNVRAHLLVPVIRSGELRVVLAVHSDTPREWSDDEIEIVQDVAERTWLAVEAGRAEAELRAERDLSRAIFDSMEEGFAIFGADWTIIDVNEIGARIARRTRSEMVGRNHWDALPETVGTPLAAMYRRVIATGAYETFEYLHELPGEESRWIEIRTYRISSGGLVVFFRDISDRKRIEQELNDAVRRRDEFLAMLAHELRNPLAPIRAAADVLSMPSMDEARIRKTSAIISRQVNHMTSLVDDLLDVSRVTRGLAVLEKERVNLKWAASTAIEQVRPLIEARRHHLTVQSPPGNADVSGDPKRLVQVLTNLLNNAAKYTPEGGHIALTIEVEGENISITVADDGIGMSADMTRRAFALFSQAEQTSDRSQGGLGIGLALVKSLVELHGGTVSATSAGAGKGSRFTVCLPRRSVESGPAYEDGDAALPAVSEKLRVLIVDDNQDAASMLEMFLEASGHSVVTEHGSRRGLERALAEQPDVCLLDIGLPDMDGNELARRLRARPETQQTVLIAVTGYGQDSDRKSTAEAGFDHHLVKPIDPLVLTGLLAAVRAR
ncbi:PAS domain-containing protein [Lysobacter korlensis]|uniref:histidine kinase n=1 Tax=Lysobacter korlensis TaxID=553636 RepID=A0ABV6RIA5_9GAMM